MIYAEVLEVPDVQKAKLPPKPTINNLLRHSRSEENIVDGVCENTSNPERKTLMTESHPSSSSIPVTLSTSDLNPHADCWSQEDDEISLQVRIRKTYWSMFSYLIECSTF